MTNNILTRNACNPNWGTQCLFLNWVGITHKKTKRHEKNHVWYFDIWINTKSFPSSYNLNSSQI